MLYWALGIAAVLFVAWYLRRQSAMRAVRSLHHLTEFATGLKELQPEVTASVSASPTESLEQGTPPPSLQTSRGVMFAWSARPAEGGFEHRMTLFSGWETWWVNGFLMAFICDRLGLQLSEASLTRTTRGTSHLNIVLPEPAHAAVLAHSIELPTSSNLADTLTRVNGLMAQVPPPSFADQPQRVEPPSQPPTDGSENGVHGLVLDTWLNGQPDERLSTFEQAGPEYAVPHRAVFCVQGIPSCTGTLYAALYPREGFADLIDFDLFQSFSSSIQQDLIRSGKVDREWFHPMPHEEAVSGFGQRLDRLASAPELPNLVPALEDMELPEEARWVLDLTYSAWVVSWGSDGLEAIAAAKEGYLTLFVVDDE